MCLTPISIPNPHLGYHLHDLYKKQSYLYDTTSSRIWIPCGVCKECIAVKQMYLVQRVQMESHNTFMFFSTLTYNNEFLPEYICPNGVRLKFADISHLQNMFKRIRNDNLFGRPFRYLAVSERGSDESKSHRPHFHILWFIPRFDGESYSDGLSLESKISDVVFNNWSVNLGSKRCPEYHPLCTYHEKFYRGKLYRNYDTHFVVPNYTSDGITSLAFYVCKYLLKQNDYERRLQRALRLNLLPHEYDEVFSVVKSRSIRSTSFGLGFDIFNRSYIVDYLSKCVQLSKSDVELHYPCFFSPESNARFPLAHYYKHFPNIYSFKDHLDFVMDTNPIVDFDKSFTKVYNGIESFNNVSNVVNSKDLGIELNFLFD